MSNRVPVNIVKTNCRGGQVEKYCIHNGRKSNCLFKYLNDKQNTCLQEKLQI